MFRFRAAAAAGLLLPALLLAAARAKPSPRNARLLLQGSRSLGAPASFRNLTVIPVFDAAARSTTPYLTLEEGLKAKRVQVKEAAGGGRVNTLLISNLSDSPLYLMGGEVVLGGQQDRCLGKDTIVPAGKRDLPVTVFCVEHGRWAGRSDFTRSARTMASAEIRAEAQNGAFAAAGPPASGSGGGRAAGAVEPDAPRSAQAAVSAAQEKVWDRVARKNRRFKAGAASGSYRGVLNLEAGDAQKSITPYLRALSASLPRDPHLVGVVAAVNGKVTAADIFGDAALFRKLWPRLLRSYAADAAENASAGGKQTAAVTAVQARDFILAAAAGKSRAESKSDVSTTLRLESKEALVYRLAPTGKAAGGFGGRGVPVHESVIRK